MTTLPEQVVIIHRCNRSRCTTATSVVDGEEVHVFDIDGEEFPWYLSEEGPQVTRVRDDLYGITVTFYVKHVDAEGVEIRDERP